MLMGFVVICLYALVLFFIARSSKYCQEINAKFPAFIIISRKALILSDMNNENLITPAYDKENTCHAMPIGT
jgi:hypothetical protein